MQGKVLVVSPNWLGDAVLSLPVVDASLQLWPEAELAVLARPLVAQIFSAREPEVRVLEYERGGGARRLVQLWRTARRLRRQQFQLALILPNSLGSALVARLAAIPQRLGYATDGRGWLLTRRLKNRRKQRGLHQADYYLELLRGLGAAQLNRVPALRLKPFYVRKAASLLSSLGVGRDELLLGVHPGAAYGETKRWLPERFAAVLERLLRPGRRILLFGAPAEEPVADRLTSEMRHPPINLVGRTSVAEAAALISRCSLFLSNDSGLMHLAAAAGVPQVALFGSTDPAKTAPLNDRAIVVSPRSVSCSPCFRRTCPYDLECMRAISVEEVYRAAEGLLERSEQ